MAKPCLTRKCIVCGVISYICTFPDSGCVSAIWLLNQVAQQISTDKKNFYWPNWVETFQKWKVKAMTEQNVGKKDKGMGGNFN